MVTAGLDPASDMPFLFELFQCRVDGTVARRMEVIQRVLEHLLDVITGCIAHLEQTEAEGLELHGMKSARRDVGKVYMMIRYISNRYTCVRAWRVRKSGQTFLCGMFFLFCFRQASCGNVEKTGVVDGYEGLQLV